MKDILPQPIYVLRDFIETATASLRRDNQRQKAAEVHSISAKQVASVKQRPIVQRSMIATSRNSKMMFKTTLLLFVRG